MAIGIAAIFSAIFFYYGYALYMGGLFRIDEVEVSPGRLYSGGIVVGTMTSILIASFQIGGISQNFKVIAEARVAGRMAYDVIDAVPDV